MDTLDAELQRLFEGLDVDATDVDSALAGIHRLNRRRTARRAAARLTAAAVVAGVLVLVGSQRDTEQAFPVIEPPEPVDLTGAVPWSDRTDYERWSPTSPIAIPRPDARPCRVGDLELIGAQMEGAGGHSGTWVRYANVSESRCTLKGFPLLGGDEGVITPEHATFFPAPRGSSKPATIDPGGEAAVVVIETSSACEPQTPTAFVTNARILLDDGTSLPTGRDLASSCPIRIDSWYREAFYPAEPPSRFDNLVTTVEVPEVAVPGDVLVYVVELRNEGASPVDLGNCAGYDQKLYPQDPVSFGPGKPLVSERLRLNCDGVGAIAPDDAVRFEMRIDVPAGYAGSPDVLLVWGLVDNMPDYSAQVWIPIDLQ